MGASGGIELARATVYLQGDDAELDATLKAATAKTKAAGVAMGEAAAAGGRGVGEGLGLAAPGAAGLAQKLGLVVKGADEAGGTFRRLERPLLGLAVATTGLDSHIGHLLVGLAAFGVGGPEITAFLAGLAVMGTAWEHLTKGPEEYEKAIQKSLDRLDELLKKQQFGGQFQTLQDQANARARVELLTEQQNTAKNFMAAGFNVEGNRKEIERLQKELDDLKDKTGAAAFELKSAIPELEGVSVTIDRHTLPAFMQLTAQLDNLNDRASEAAKAVDIMVKSTIAFGAFSENVPSSILPSLFQRGIRGNIGLQAGQPGTPSPFAIGRTNNALDIFSGARLGPPRHETPGLSIGAGVKAGAKDAFKDFKSLFDPKTIASTAVGGVLSGGMSVALGFLTSKLGGVLSNVFEAGAQKLAKAMEQNTKALTASNDFLHARVAATGIEAKKVSEALGTVLDKYAVGELGTTNLKNALLYQLGGPTALLKNSPWAAKLDQLAKALGISLDQLSPESARQFAEALAKAGYGLDALGASARQLANVPDVWNVALGRFRAVAAIVSGLVTPTGASDSSGRSFTFTGNIVLPGVRNGQQFVDQLEDAVVRMAARGGAPVLRDATQGVL